MDPSEIIPLEKLKNILKESLDASTTFGDFYTNVLARIYKLGYEDGKESAVN